MMDAARAFNVSLYIHIDIERTFLGCPRAQYQYRSYTVLSVCFCSSRSFFSFNMRHRDDDELMMKKKADEF